jgi:hypothetical protein
MSGTDNIYRLEWFTHTSAHEAEFLRGIFGNRLASITGSQFSNPRTLAEQSFHRECLEKVEINPINRTRQQLISERNLNDLCRDPTTY